LWHSTAAEPVRTHTLTSDFAKCVALKEIHLGIPAALAAAEVFDSFFRPAAIVNLQLPHTASASQIKGVNLDQAWKHLTPALASMQCSCI